MLTSESLKRIDREIAKYPADQKQSAVMAALAIAQEQQGWLSSEAIECVANYLGMAPIAAYEVATFYNMYDLQAGRQVQGLGVYQSAVHAHWWRRCRRVPEEQAWYRL
jgi:NADH:ubiquinone oxidoreductase subunit E